MTLGENGDERAKGKAGTLKKKTRLK